MAKHEFAVFTNMCMVYDDDGNILVQDRLNPSELDQYTLANDFEDMFRIFESDTLSEFYYYKHGGRWEKKLL